MTTENLEQQRILELGNKLVEKFSKINIPAHDSCKEQKPVRVEFVQTGNTVTALANCGSCNRVFITSPNEDIWYQTFD